MGRIFAMAEEVLIWLGEPTSGLSCDPASVPGEAAEATVLIEALASGRHWHELSYFARCLAEDCRATALTEETSASYARNRDVAYRALVAFTGAAWFKRTWTVQEVVLASPTHLR